MSRNRKTTLNKHRTAPMLRKGSIFSICLLAVLMTMIPSVIFAEIFPKVGTAGLQFLKLGVDARAIGMGEAYTAVADDISSVYWNPAGLSLSRENQLMFSHTNWFANINHEFFAASRNTDFGAVALSVSFLHMDQMDITTEELFGPTGETFSPYNLALGLTYSNQFTDRFSFGMTGKFLRESLGWESQHTVNGVAVDLGTTYNTGWRNLIIGMALTNFGPDLEYTIDNDGDGLFDEDPFDLIDNDGDGLIDEDREEFPFKLPMNFSLALAVDLYRSGNNALISSIQLDNCVDRKETWNIGAEYKIATFAIRSGYQFNYDEAGLSLGLGWRVPVRFAIIDLDYAYTSMGDLEETSLLSKAQRLSLKIRY